jgi:hypothetical protein
VGTGVGAGVGGSKEAWRWKSSLLVIRDDSGSVAGLKEISCGAAR